MPQHKHHSCAHLTLSLSDSDSTPVSALCNVFVSLTHLVGAMSFSRLPCWFRLLRYRASGEQVSPSHAAKTELQVKKVLFATADTVREKQKPFQHSPIGGGLLQLASSFITGFIWKALKVDSVRDLDCWASFPDHQIWILWLSRSPDMWLSFPTAGQMTVGIKITINANMLHELKKPFES